MFTWKIRWRYKLKNELGNQKKKIFQLNSKSFYRLAFFKLVFSPLNMLDEFAQFEKLKFELLALESHI